jgi:hypothetical protein
MSKNQPMLGATAAPPAVDPIDEILAKGIDGCALKPNLLEKPEEQRPVPAFSSILVMTDPRTFLF